MADRVHRELIHKVNNLLTVIYTQVEVGRASASQDGCLQALDQILRTAEATVPFLRAATALDGADGDAPQDGEGA